MIDPPHGWGDDTLSESFDMARLNSYASFANKRPAVADLVEIDRLFPLVIKDARNLKPFFPANFFLRSHSAFRVAAQLAMSGQAFEATAMMRLLLEHAGYGLFIGADTERLRRWFARGENRQNDDAFRKEFSANAIKRCVSERHAQIGHAYQHLYNHCLNFGAHPNEAGAMLSTAIKRGDELTVVETIYMHDKPLVIDAGLKATAQCGLTSLRIAQLVYPARFDEVGATARVDALCQRY